MTGSITLEEVKSSLPTHLKSAASQTMCDTLNSLAQTPEIVEVIRNNMISYGHVIREGKFKVEDYLNAVAYVSFKLMGHTNHESYKLTFPQRYQILATRGATDKEISAYVAAYNKGKLVNLILEQTLVPTWVLNQDIYQKAINVQAELMMTANSEKVRAEAANSLLTHLKKPEGKQVSIDIDVKESKSVTDLKDMLTTLAQAQQTSIEGGVSTKTIAHQDLKATAVKDITPRQEPDVEDAEIVDAGGEGSADKGLENGSFSHQSTPHQTDSKISKPNPAQEKRDSIFGKSPSKKPLSSFVPGSGTGAE